MVKALIAFRIIGSSGGDAKFGYGTRILRVIHGRDARATSHLITHARSCRRKNLPRESVGKKSGPRF